MTRPVDPDLVRNLADRIEGLPDHINDPRRMPFVQETLRVALEQYRSDREAQALGREIMGDPGKAEEYRQAVAFVKLRDDEKRAIEEGFKQDETGFFEKIERDAAEIGEWLKECRHPRDAERFRESLRFVCSDMVVWPVLGVEVRLGVYKLDLSVWEAEVAKPICDYLRRLADEITNEAPPGVAPAVVEWSKLIGYNDLRTALGISHNTLKDRLIESREPVVGKIRHQKANKGSRKIQVAIVDLPADLQTRYRPRK